MHGKVLVLNASFEPISICTIRKAVVLLLKGAATAEESRFHWLHSSRFSMPAPAVIRLVDYAQIPFKGKGLSRKSVYQRDRNTCQYCERKLSTEELTLDHVKPRSRGGPDTWDNLVTCCSLCNNLKGDRTPEEAGMELICQPRMATFHQYRDALRSHGQMDDAWRKYLFY